MSEQRLVKIQNVLGNQIPAFLSQESPLFQEFLKQYYISQEHSTGVLDLVSNLNSLKNIETYSKDVFYTSNPNNRCYLTDIAFSFSDTLSVNSTFGFPDKYGLLKIGNEVITYKSKTETSFEECARGFSGVTDITDVPNTASLVFSETDADDHLTNTTVENLNLVFYLKLFEKFKAHYLPDFEGRQISSNVNLELFLSRARDFYSSKGSDISYKILFELLYNDNISLFKPQEYLIRPSLNNNLVTKNILVEIIGNNIEPGNLTDLIGLTLYQDIAEGVTASASIYNVEYRPTDELDLFEISLDSDSFIYEFVSCKKTIVTEKADNGLFVDSTIGFPSSGELYVKLKSNQTFDYQLINYEEKSINKFSNIDSTVLESINPGDELIENKLARVILDDLTTLEFRILNVIQFFDYTNTSTSRSNETINISSFGENFSNSIEFDSWLYNYPTNHRIKSYDSEGVISLYDSVQFKLNEIITLVSNTGTTTETKVIGILNPNTIIVVKNYDSIGNIEYLKKKIIRSDLNQSESAYVQNVYYNPKRDSIVVASSGLPHIGSEIELNKFEFKLVGIEFDNNKECNKFLTYDIKTDKEINHNLMSGHKVYYESSFTTGEYYIKKINNTTILLYDSLEKLSLSYSLSSDKESTHLKEGKIGNIIAIEYKNTNKDFTNQLFLKEFTIKNTLKENKIIADNKINNVEDAYLVFKS